MKETREHFHNTDHRQLGYIGKTLQDVLKINVNKTILILTLTGQIKTKNNKIHKESIEDLSSAFWPIFVAKGSGKKKQDIL